MNRARRVGAFVPRALDPALRPSLARRAGALGLDVLILVLFVLLTQWTVRAVLGEGLEARLRTGPELYRWTLLTVALPVWSYFWWAEASWGATAGKRALGLRVREAEQERLRHGVAFRRTAVKLLPWELLVIGWLLPSPLHATPEAGTRWALLAGLVLYALYAAAAARSPAHQAPHDRAAGTVVVRRA